MSRYCPICATQNHKTRSRLKASHINTYKTEEFTDEFDEVHKHPLGFILKLFVCLQGHKWFERTPAACGLCEYQSICPDEGVEVLVG